MKELNEEIEMNCNKMKCIDGMEIVMKMKLNEVNNPNNKR